MLLPSSKMVMISNFWVVITENFFFFTFQPSIVITYIANGRLFMIFLIPCSELHVSIKLGSIHQNLFTMQYISDKLYHNIVSGVHKLMYQISISVYNYKSNAYSSVMMNIMGKTMFTFTIGNIKHITLRALHATSRLFKDRFEICVASKNSFVAVLMIFEI